MTRSGRISSRLIGLAFPGGFRSVVRAPVVCVAMAAPAWDIGGLDEIVVTAQLRHENLQDTPVAIMADEADMLDARSETANSGTVYIISVI